MSGSGGWFGDGFDVPQDNVSGDAFAAFSDVSNDPLSGDSLTTYGASLPAASGDVSAPTDWTKLIATIGSTFVSTFNAVNPPANAAPPATHSYSATQASGGTTPASGSSSLFSPPNIYYFLGAGAIVLFLVSQKNQGGS